ncbi:MAG: biotin/lipoyl-containing protein [Syntrophaceae bacterium]
MSVVEAPFPGTISEILVKVGDSVKEDDEMIIIEAMKMKNPLVSPADGKVKEIKVKEQEEVQTGQVLAVIE